MREAAAVDSFRCELIPVCLPMTLSWVSFRP